jgi:glycosyltransferase involved in cell wall biosynthesis
MTPVSVIIPTFNRPDYLREALESVRAQTARERIGQVIVSENSLSDFSEKVSRDFNDLPINYVRQRPPQPPRLHLQSIWKNVRHPIVAFLHDDDWWAADHLAGALEMLDSNSRCAAVFSNFYETTGPTFPAQVSTDKAWRIWAGSGCNFAGPILTLDPMSMTLICLLDSNFHYSTVVGRNDAIWNAYLKVVETENNYDTDRLFGIFLSKHGQIGYLTRPDVFVRLHPDQDCMREENMANGWAMKAETTRWLLKTESENIARAVEQFNRNMGSFPADLLSRFVRDIGEPHLTALTDDCGLHLRPRQHAPKALQPPPAMQPIRDARWLLKQLCPPFIQGLTRRFQEHWKRA